MRKVRAEQSPDLLRLAGLVAGLFFYPCLASATQGYQPQYFTYQARIVDSSGNPVTGNTDFVFQVLSPTGCVLYTEETPSASPVSLPSTGVLSWQVGNGARINSGNLPAGTVPGEGGPFPLDSGYRLDEVFSDISESGLPTMTGASPSGTGSCTYTLGANDARMLMTYWSPHGAGTWTAVDAGDTISAVPVATVAETLAGMNPANTGNLANLGNSVTGNTTSGFTVNGALTTTGLVTASEGLSSGGPITTSGGGSYLQVGGQPTGTPGSYPNGSIWYSGGTLYYSSGGDATPLQSGSSGISSIDSDTSAAQTLSVSATGTSLGWVDGGGGSHTLDIPMADGSDGTSVTAGLISYSDYQNLLTSSGASSTYVPLAGTASTSPMTGPLVNNSDSSSTALAVTQSGSGYAATFSGGDVGIGTTTPYTDLQVYDANPPATAYGYSGPMLSLGRTINQFGTGGSVDFQFDWTAFGGNEYYTQSRIVSFDTLDYGGNLAFYTKPADGSWSSTPGGSGSDTSVERMRITNTGNVGIGTTAPASILNVTPAPSPTTTAGSVSIGEGGWAGASGNFSGSSSGTELAINAKSGYGGDLANFEVNGVSMFKVDASGNVTEAGTVTQSGSTDDTGTVNINTTGSSGVTTIGGNGGAVYVGTSGSEGVSVGSSSNSTTVTGTVVTINGSGSGTTSVGTGSTGGVTIGDTSGGTTTIQGTTTLSGATTLSSTTAVSGGADNSVLFLNSSGDVATDNAKLSWLDSSGYLGIGTSSPVDALTVSGDGTTIAKYDGGELAQVHANSGTVYSTISDSDTTAASGIYDLGDGYVSTLEGAWFGSLTNAPVNFRTDNVERMRITTSGNVGIGTTAPVSSLSVTAGSSYDANGTLSSLAQFDGPTHEINIEPEGDQVIGFNSSYKNGTGRVNSTAASTFTGSIDFSPSTGDLNFWVSTAAVTSGASDNEQKLLMLNDSGASANYGMASVGDGLWDGSSSGHFAGSSSGTELAVNSSSSFAGNLIDLQQAGVSRFAVSASGAITSGGETSNGTVDINTTGAGVTTIGGSSGTIAIGGGGSVSIGASGSSGVTIGNSSSGTTEIQGTTSETGTVTINGSGSAATSVGTGSTGGVTIGDTSGGTTTLQGATTLSSATTVSGTAANSVLFTNASNQVATDNAKLSWLDSSGELGIGTTSPGGLLDVHGSAGDMQVATDGVDLQFTRGDANYIQASSTGGWLDFIVNGNSTSDGTAAMKIDTNNNVYFPNGEVGIGTTSPTSPLTVNASSGSVTPIQVNAPGAYINLNSTSGDWNTLIGANNGTTAWEIGEAGGQDAGGVGFYTYPSGTAAEQMFISQSGNVGIGTTSPQMPLHVWGSVDVGNPALTAGPDSGIQIFGYNAYGNGLALYNGYVANSTMWMVRNDGGSMASPNAFVIASAPASNTANFTDQFVINTSGNVGIGTSSPLAPLQVAGVAAIGQIFSTGNNTYAVSPTNADIVLGSTAYGSTRHDSSIMLWSSGSAERMLAHSGSTGDQMYFSTWDEDALSAPGSIISVEPGAYSYFSGNVGIGTTTPGYTLQVNGSVAGTSAYVNTSDERLKKNIRTIPDAVEKILKLRGVTFDWRRDEHPEMNLSDRQQLGVIAQEVEKVFPQAVSEDQHTGFKSVAYSMLIGPLIESVKSVYHQLLAYEHRNDTRVANLEKDVTDLKTADRKLASMGAAVIDDRQPAELENRSLKHQLAQQQKTIDQLKALVCQDHPKAALCAAAIH